MEMEGVPVIVHATVGGVQVDFRRKWAKGNTIVGEFRPKVEVSQGVQHTLSLLGSKYDYVGLLGYLLVVFWWRWFGRKIKNPIVSPTGLVCSELLVHLSHDGSIIPEWAEMDPERTTPQDLLAACEAGSSFERII